MNCTHCDNTGHIGVDPFFPSISKRCPFCHPVTRERQGKPVICCGNTDDFVMQTKSGYWYVSGNEVVCHVQPKELNDGFFLHPVDPQTWQRLKTINETAHA